MFGALGNISMRLAMGAVGLVITPALALYWRTARSKDVIPQDDEPSELLIDQVSVPNQ